MSNYQTTLSNIRNHGPCKGGWEKLLAHLGKTKADDEPLDFLTILESNGLNDFLWCLHVEPKYNSTWRLLAVRMAREVQHLMTDPRSVAALDVAERHANGTATDDELAAARAAAETATWAAGDAARAAVATAGDAAWAAARAARDAAWAAAEAAAAWAAAWAAARDAARSRQVEIIKEVLSNVQ